MIEVNATIENVMAGGFTDQVKEQVAPDATAIADCVDYIRGQLDDTKEAPPPKKGITRYVSDIWSYWNDSKGQTACREAAKAVSKNTKNTASEGDVMSQAKEAAKGYFAKTLPDVAEVVSDSLWGK
jgi:hypothetical protein